jgi:hypothetical protein
MNFLVTSNTNPRHKKDLRIIQFINPLYKQQESSKLSQFKVFQEFFYQNF